jgi:hypothetical protein
MSAESVYSKTELGRSEVARRSLGLHGRQRSILIMVDGRKSSAELALALPGGVVEGILGELLGLGLIGTATQGAVELPAPAPKAEVSPLLAGIKQQMRGAAETYLGLMAADIVRRIERAADAAALTAVLGHWHMALQDSKHGKAVALELLEQVRSGLAGAEA